MGLGVTSTGDHSPAEQAYIGLHARAFTPSTRVESIPEVMSGYADSTLLTMLQLAAYTAPGMYEHGTALTVQEETPSFAFYPNMPGDVTLGHQWSSETGELTKALLNITPDRHFHTAFVGDTGFGKSIAAERMALETTRQWHYRSIVLDFGQGWRKALPSPGARAGVSPAAPERRAGTGRPGRGRAAPGMRAGAAPPPAPPGAADRPGCARSAGPG